MQTKKARTIHERRRQQERKRFASIDGRVAAGDLVSMASDAKWVKILDALRECCDRGANVTVKIVDRDEPIERAGLLEAYFDQCAIESRQGLLAYSEIEWIRVPLAREPAFSFAVDYGIQDGAITVWGYRRV